MPQVTFDRQAEGVGHAYLDLFPHHHEDDYTFEDRRVPIVDGQATFTVDETPVGNALVIQERGFDGARRRTVLIPATNEDYDDLEDVDPDTLDPTEEPEAAWDAVAEALDARIDALESAPPGSGDVTGPASSTDNRVVRMDGVTGKSIQESPVTISDAGLISGGSMAYADLTGTPSSLPPNGGAGGVLSGSYPNPGFAVDMAEQGELDAHTTNVTNPHSVTKSQVGLGNVDNTTDANKPVSGPQQAALDLKANIADLADVATSGDAADLTGTLPSSVLPPLAVNETFPVASEAAMLALTAQRGDVAVRTDLDPDRTFILTTDSPGTLADWIEIQAGGVQTVNGEGGPSVVLNKGHVGLANVDNTSDVNKPVSTAQQAALATKADDADLDAHIADTTDAHDASAISFTPGSGIAATDAQAAIEEAKNDAEASLTTHLNDATDAHDASSISYAGSTSLAATDVEAALDELDTEKASTGSVTTVQGNLTDHLNDTTDAHDASAISYAGSAELAATDVEAALDELDTEKVSPSGTATLTNKRITRRVLNVADTATLTIDSDSYDGAKVTALAQAMTIAAPTGTTTAMQGLIIRIKDNGTARALTWNAAFRAIGVTLPTTTVVSKTLYVGCIRNTDDTKWDVIALAVEA